MVSNPKPKTININYLELFPAFRTRYLQSLGCGGKAAAAQTL